MFCKGLFSTRSLRFYAVALSLIGLISLNACQDHRLPPAPAVKPDVVFYALTDGNQLLKLNVQNPETAIATNNITGLQANEKLLAIDFRPATGQLYGVGSSSRIYVLNPETGMARAIGSAPFSPGINGTEVAFDFNPTVDRIRLVTNLGQNLRLNPETGAVMIVDGSVNGAPGVAISAAAYTNNRAGQTTTTLYNLDAATDRLYRQDPPNNGTQVVVGSLLLDITAAGGFDISPNGSLALAAVTVEGKSEIDQVDLTTGRMQKLGNLPAGANIIGLAIPTEPVAYAVDLSNNLLIFNPTNTPISLSSRAITGLQPGEQVLGLDMRPVNGQLYALGSTSRLYTINASSGAATVVGSGFAPALSGTDFGFDFNPTVDRIRVVSNTGQNLRLHPDTGGLAVEDQSLKPGTPAVTAAAYTNNFAGATTTVLFDIDSNTDKLYQQLPPNDGVLVEVGNLGIDVTATNGFDITGTSGTAYAILTTGSTTKIYRITLSTGAATAVSDFPSVVRGMSVGLGF